MGALMRSGPSAGSIANDYSNRMTGMTYQTMQQQAAAQSLFQRSQVAAGQEAFHNSLLFQQRVGPIVKNKKLHGLETIRTSPLGDTSQAYTGRARLLGN